MNTIRQRQKNWLSHVLRSESRLRAVLEGRMEGTRTRRRQCYDDRLDDHIKKIGKEEVIPCEILTKFGMWKVDVIMCEIFSDCLYKGCEFCEGNKFTLSH